MIENVRGHRTAEEEAVLQAQTGKISAVSALNYLDMRGIGVGVVLKQQGGDETEALLEQFALSVAAAYEDESFPQENSPATHRQEKAAPANSSRTTNVGFQQSKILEGANPQELEKAIERLEKAGVLVSNTFRYLCEERGINPWEARIRLAEFADELKKFGIHEVAGDFDHDNNSEVIEETRSRDGESAAIYRVLKMGIRHIRGLFTSLPHAATSAPIMIAEVPPFGRDDNIGAVN